MSANGSKAAVRRSAADFRSTPLNRHVAVPLQGQRRANRRHCASRSITPFAQVNRLTLAIRLSLTLLHIAQGLRPVDEAPGAV